MGNLQILGLGEGQTAQLTFTDILGLTSTSFGVFLFSTCSFFFSPCWHWIRLDWTRSGVILDLGLGYFVSVWFFGKSFHCFSSFEFESLSDSVF